jgi:xanthine dehydrogenase accessory factor
MSDSIVIIKGAGDLASGVAHRLHNCGFAVIMTELSSPLVVRRTVSFAEAVYAGKVVVEDVQAVLARSFDDVKSFCRQGIIPVLVDPAGELVKRLKPSVLIDATMAKRNTGTRIGDAPAVIALGPGFWAGRDVHAVIETMRGHHLGRVWWEGTAIPDTGEPEPVNGYTHKRLLRAPADGFFTAVREIGDSVEVGETLGFIGEHPVKALISGIIRGLIRDGCAVKQGLKIGDIDPREKREYCYLISDKARSVAGGVLEAILKLTRTDNAAERGRRDACAGL